MDFKKNPETDFKPAHKLSEEEAREEVEALREGIEHHDYLYYIKNKPDISDAAYDKLFRRLEELEEIYPDLRSDTSPTRRVGAEPVEELKKVHHKSPMLSLNAGVKEEEVRAFHRFVQENMGAGKTVYVAEPKFDGLSVEMVYEKGKSHKDVIALRKENQEGEALLEKVMEHGRRRRDPESLETIRERFEAEFEKLEDKHKTLEKPVELEVHLGPELQKLQGQVVHEVKEKELGES